MYEIETGEFDALISAGTLLKAHVRSSAFVEMIRKVKESESCVCLGGRGGGGGWGVVR